MITSFPPGWLEGLDRWFAQYQDGAGEPRRVAVAFSAGADSTALLLATNHVWPGKVVALHVHHGMQAAADGFETQARRTCAALTIPISVTQLSLPLTSGRSPEEVARTHRYAALADMAREADAQLVLLAQHADDQAETVLLALSRGAGMPGLAAMPSNFERHGVVFGRPWLEKVRAAEVRQWLSDRGVPYVDDPTNQDESYTRNRIRSRLSPAWESCFPGFEKALARTARHAAQASSLLDELALMDLSVVGDPPRIKALQILSADRQGNVLRYWLRQRHGVQASAAQLAELLSQLKACSTRGHRIEIKVADGKVLRQDETLVYLPPV